MSKLTDERAKLTANWLNAVASGVMITGVVAPVVAAYFGVPGPANVGPLTLSVSARVWFFAALGLPACKNCAAEPRPMTALQIYGSSLRHWSSSGFEPAWLGW
jgi:hypothetical protein